MDAGPPELVRLVIGLARALDVYDPEAGDFDAERTVFYDLPGGAALIDLWGVLSNDNLVTLREVLDCSVDVQRGGNR
jgi:hypothetical protein